MTPENIAGALISPAESRELVPEGPRPGKVDAAVLIPLYWTDRGPVAVFTERDPDLRKHAGEISFPGGRQDPGEDLVTTAVREAEEEIGLSREVVRVLGALPPLGTFVSNFTIYPFVAEVPAGLDWVRAEREVAQVLEFSLDDLRAAHRSERLWSKGVPVRTPTFRMGEHLIWGATARILHDFLLRLGSLRP
ncbi:MAG: CoA pyrophosphatase [Propionibacteriales bacterium]|nr:CoA pyrophosphatase [Propionibacteriales bacterium]